MPSVLSTVNTFGRLTGHVECEADRPRSELLCRRYRAPTASPESRSPVKGKFFGIRTRGIGHAYVLVEAHRNSG